MADLNNYPGKAANDLRVRAARLRELAKYGNNQDFKAEMAEADRLDQEARLLEESHNNHLGDSGDDN